MIPNGVDTDPLRPVHDVAADASRAGHRSKPIRWSESSRHCGRKKTTSCFWKWLAALSRNCRPRDFSSSATARAAQTLEQLRPRSGLAIERSISRLAQRRATAARRDGRVRAHVAQRSQSGVDPGSDERRPAGRRNERRLDSVKRSSTARRAFSCRRAMPRSSHRARPATCCTIRLAAARWAPPAGRPSSPLVARAMVAATSD